MELFNQEKINITKIHSINKYVSPEEFAKNRKIIYYNTNLKYYELVFFISSESETHFNGVDIEDDINSLRYLPKNIDRGKYYVQGKTPGFCIDIIFDTDLPMPDHAIGIKNMDVLRDKYIKIYNLWQAQKPDYYLKCMQILYEIISLIRNNSGKYISVTQKESLNKAYEYINDNYRQCSFDYEKLCEASGFHYSHFHKLFTAMYRMSPVKMVTKLRLNYAKELLLGTQLPINKISEECGFENVCYFSTVFKKNEGLSPLQFRNRRPH